MAYVNAQAAREFNQLNQGLGDWWDDREEVGMRVVEAFLADEAECVRRHNEVVDGCMNDVQRPLTAMQMRVHFPLYRESIFEDDYYIV